MHQPTILSTNFQSSVDPWDSGRNLRASIEYGKNIIQFRLLKNKNETEARVSVSPHCMFKLKPWAN